MKGSSTLESTPLEEVLSKPWVRQFLLRPVLFWRGQAAALACALIAALLREAITPLVGSGVPFLTFFPAVVAASVVAGPLAGFSALVVSTALAAATALASGADLAPGAAARLIAFWLLCLLLIAIISLLRALAQTLAASEEQAHILARESAHRARNVLGIVQAMARQTARGAADIPEFLPRFDARLSALARAQELLFGSQTDLKSFLELVLAPFGLDRFLFDGLSVAVPEEHGVPLALLFHELATNAMKYGALTAPDRRVTITWETKPGALSILWREHGGPPVRTPAQEGFGVRLFASAFRPGRGAASIAFEPAGLICRIELPLDGRQARGDA